MRTAFVDSGLADLLEEGVITTSDSIIAVCAGSSERDLFARLGFTNVLITNLGERIAPDVDTPWKGEGVAITPRQRQ